MISSSSHLKICVNHKKLKISLIDCKKVVSIQNTIKINQLISQILVPLIKIKNLDKNRSLHKCLTNLNNNLYVNLINLFKLNTSKEVQETFKKFLTFTVKIKVLDFKDQCHLINKTRTTQDLIDLKVFYQKPSQIILMHFTKISSRQQIKKTKAI
mgnify:CR=1 FL=1